MTEEALSDCSLQLSKANSNCNNSGDTENGLNPSLLAWLRNARSPSNKVIETEYLPTWKDPEHHEGFYKCWDKEHLESRVKNWQQQQQPTGDDEVQNDESILKRKRDNVFDVDMNPSQGFEGFTYFSRKDQTKFRHALLGNQIGQQVSQQQHESEEFLFFLPDFINQLHQSLTKLQQEYAWLMEESIHIYRSIDDVFLYRYASPYLKIQLRKDRNAIIPPHLQQAFDQKRAEVRRLLQQGQRRGPIMSRIIAKLRLERRWELINKQKTAALSSKQQTQLSTSVQPTASNIQASTPASP